MPANSLAIFLSLMLISIVWATSAFPITDERQEGSEIACTKGFLEGYACRKRQRVDRIIGINRDSIGLIENIRMRRAAEGLQNVPIPSEIVGLFPYLGWHRELYGLADIKAKDIAAYPMQNGESPGSPAGNKPIPGLPPSALPDASPTPEQSSNGAPAIPDEKNPLPSGTGNRQSPDANPGTGGADPGILPSTLESGSEDNEISRTGTQPEKTDGQSADGKTAQSSIPPMQGDSKPGIGGELPGTSENGTAVPVTGESQFPIPGAPKEDRIIEKDNQDPEGGTIPPAGDTDKDITEARQTNGQPKAREVVAEPILHKTREYDFIRECLRNGRCTDPRGKPSPSPPVSKPDDEKQALEIYRLDNCIPAPDRGKPGISADNLCVPEGRLLAGFRPGKYEIAENNFLPSHRPLLTGVERALSESARLPKDWWVLILGHADYLKYTGSTPRIGLPKTCFLHEKTLQFHYFDATDGRLAGDPNRLLAFARANEARRWLKRRGIIDSKQTCLMAYTQPPAKGRGNAAGDALNRAVTVYVLRSKPSLTEANHAQP
uniref:OmpA family protein n=1 Tax=Candidatus Kentrum sp. MB TaxID=2138164 RepID=A0A451BFI0_9GAMM|nr:MAG: hypothetical protein BECKMB1821G_GA0114241_10903 [Candidatus Kentron sp. MB]VFK34869.1 MAG: hypothetical protein BECKMB1821I_GA0114274_10883 [Candidatus Kentron sp. MB]VFK77012.1 MAG: hypothetical protein BECKMB1821H_GA0114242_10903 [Candidatus Kentron sp. MB]